MRVASYPLIQYSMVMTDLESKMQAEIDQGKAAFTEMAPVVAAYYKGLRKSGVSTLPSIALTVGSFWMLAQRRQSD